MGLWVLAGSWSSGNLTDGFVPKEIAKRWDSSGRLATKLVSSGLWAKAEKDDEAGYQFHQWKDQNPLKTDVLARRQATADRVARHRKSKETSNEDVSNDVGNALHDELPTESVTPPPSRPDPTRPEKKEETAPRKRGARLPDDWVPAEMVNAQMRRECPEIDLDAELDVFRDYWIAQPGQKGTKTDWDATWRNWVRRARPRTQQGPSAIGPSRQDAKVQSYLDYANGPEARKAIG